MEETEAEDRSVHQGHPPRLGRRWRSLASRCSASVMAAAQMAVTFEDVAVRFTEEEWGQLDISKRMLYWEVMLETCEHLVTVGCPWSKSELIYQLEHSQDLWAAAEVLSQSSHPDNSTELNSTKPSPYHARLARALLQDHQTEGASRDSLLELHQGQDRP